MKIAVWYHCKISGQGIPDRNASEKIVAEQMRALRDSGLESAADEIHIGVNGGYWDSFALSFIIPEKAVFHVHGHDSRSELPTMCELRSWLGTHGDWAVCYHHSKGVTKPRSGEKKHHRLLMEKACIWDWKKCVSDLERGYDAVGINLVHPIKRPVLPGTFFAGNFWWAKASYLLTLPALPQSVSRWCDAERCMAEGWIGSSKANPRMMDYERPELYQLT